MTEKKKDETKQCELCAEAIPLEVEKCPYCPATYSVTIRGYCKNCHTLSAADASGRCLKCGSEVADLQINSTFKGEAPLAATVAAAPIIKPEAAPVTTASILKPAVAPGVKQPARKLTTQAWALIVTGIVLVVAAAAGVTMWLLSGRGPLAKYNSWPVVFADDFNSNQNHWQLANWGDDYSRGSSLLDGNRLHIQAYAYQSAAFIQDIPYAQLLGDFCLTVRFKQVGGSTEGSNPSSAGIIFHSIGDYDFFYIFEIRASQNAQLAVVDHGEYKVINGPYIVNVYAPGEYNDVVVIYEQGTISAYVNGALVLSQKDDRFPAGRLALQGWLQYAGDTADYYLDSIEIRVP